MERPMTLYGTAVDNAIREAFARGDRPSEVRVRLKAGTLPGIDRPIEMAERTFWNKWGKAKREQGASQGPNRAFSILDVIAFDIARRDAGLEDEDDPKGACDGARRRRTEGETLSKAHRRARAGASSACRGTATARARVAGTARESSKGRVDGNRPSIRRFRRRLVGEGAGRRDALGDSDSSEPRPSRFLQRHHR